jgi:hypothetical protein
MKPGSKMFKKMMKVLRQFSICVIAIGAVIFINEYPAGKWILSLGGILWALYSFMKGFEPVFEEPNWELVYPELGLGHFDDFDMELDLDVKVNNAPKTEEI